MPVLAHWTPPGSGLVGARRPRRRTLSERADVVPACHLGPPDSSPSPESSPMAATSPRTVPPVAAPLLCSSSSSSRAVPSRIQCSCPLPSPHPTPRRPAHRPCSSGVATSPPIQRARPASALAYKRPRPGPPLLTTPPHHHTSTSRAPQQEPGARLPQLRRRLRRPIPFPRQHVPATPSPARLHLRAQCTPLVPLDLLPERIAAGVATADEPRSWHPPEKKGATPSDRLRPSCGYREARLLAPDPSRSSPSPAAVSIAGERRR